ncbi:hypothetical protein ONE63_000210 [Megalurothrips usitatus]|uniref:Mitochondrial ATP synthase regulatory component factor B n=1 Tax=Megalurothrips usitatus TaxID=439358 RepID=A0AAV7XXR0_9NEOP|nr:hypothetical protein ONE63_000210 [Megalurothrips usitatus]
MFSSGRSCSRILSAVPQASYSSIAKKFDPRNEEVNRTLVPWQYSENYKKRPGFFAGVIQSAGTMTEMIKFLSTPIDLRGSKITSWYEKKLYARDLEQQEYDANRVASLGSNISAAHGFWGLGARVLFKGKAWMKLDPGKHSNLPEEHDPEFVLEAIDISGCAIHYEGLRHLRNLNGVHSLTARNCPHIDDWCLDIIASELLGLEVLDISGCKRVTPRGLAALKHIPNLHTLDLSDCPALQTDDGILMCILLQDYNPKLNIKGIEYPDIPQNDNVKYDVKTGVKDCPSTVAP